MGAMNASEWAKMAVYSALALGAAAVGARFSHLSK